MRPPVAFLFLLLLGTPHSLAQTTTAAITGVVRTRDGSPAPGAVVVARSSATGVERTAPTGPDGRYRIDLLAPGEWIILARLGDALASEERALRQDALSDRL